MEEQFRGFLGYSEEEIKELWEKAIIVVDTNILLNFYKYTSEESTQSLLGILKKLKDSNRLWIPYHVAIEYMFNYEGNQLKQHEGFELLGKELMKLKEDAEKSLRKVKSDHPYIDTNKFNFYIDKIEEANSSLKNELDKTVKSLPNTIDIEQELLTLMTGIVGDSFTQKEIDEIEKEGKIRYAKLIPPGFDDFGKPGKDKFRTYGHITYQQHFGDLIVWKQLLAKVSEMENPSPLIFITEDRKKDWWELKEDGKKIHRPQPHLIQEFLNLTNQKFYMYRTKQFVKYAKDYLDPTLTDEQVQVVTNEVEYIRKVEEQINRNYILHGLEDIDIERLITYLPESIKKEVAFALQTKNIINNNFNDSNFRKVIAKAAILANSHIKDELFEITHKLSHYEVEAANKIMMDLNKVHSLEPFDQVKKLFNLIDFASFQLEVYTDWESEMNNDMPDKNERNHENKDWDT